MLCYGFKDSEVLCWRLKITDVVVVFIFLERNGLCGRMADSNYFYTEEPIPLHKFLCTRNAVCVHVRNRACNL